MPKRNPPSSFEGAVRHLFRHLRDARALKDNPLVREFFVASRELAPHLRDRAALDLIQRLVREAADEIAAAARSVDDESSRRQHAIVMMHCLEGRSLDEVAASLGISQRQCYRERDIICKRIARHIEQYERECAATAPMLDDFALRMSQAAFRREVNDDEGALSDYESIVRSTSAWERKVEALCKIAEIHLDRGDPRDVMQACEIARSLITGGDSPNVTMANARLARVHEQMEWHEGRFGDALATAANVAETVRPLSERGIAGALPLYVDALVSLGGFHGLKGDLRQAMALLCEAASFLQTDDSRPYMRIQVELEVAGLRGKLSADAAYWQPARERLRHLTSLYDRARALGLPYYIRLAAFALCVHYVQVGDDDAALQASDVVLALAQRSPRFTVEPYSVPTLLAMTSHWRRARSIVREIDAGDAIVPFRWQLQLVMAECHRRAGDHVRALEAVSDLSEEPLRLNHRLRVLTVKASAANVTAQRRTAIESIEEAVSVAEHLSIATRLVDAYRVAADVTRDERYRRRAREITMALRA